MFQNLELTIPRSARISFRDGGIQVQMDGESPAPLMPQHSQIFAHAPVPRIGEVWAGQGGRLAGMTRDAFLILPTDERAFFEGVSYGCDGKVIGASDEWDGMANTEKMAAAGSDLAKNIRALEIGGHRDFYLMARREAPIFYASLREAFETDYYYLTSTEYSADFAWCQDFSDGGQGSTRKDGERRAFAVRRVPFSSLFLR